MGYVNPYSRASTKHADVSYRSHNYARSATVQSPSRGRHGADERDLPRSSSSSNVPKRTYYTSSGVPYPDDNARSAGQHAPDAYGFNLPDHSFCREQAYLAHVSRRCKDDGGSQHCLDGGSDSSSYASSDDDWLEHPPSPPSPVQILQDPAGSPHVSRREEPHTRCDSGRSSG